MGNLSVRVAVSPPGPLRGGPVSGAGWVTVALLTLAALAVLPAEAQAQAVSMPSAPMNLRATTDSMTRIGLSWTAPMDAGGPNAVIAGYTVEYAAPYHSSSSGGPDAWEVLEADTRSTATTYTHEHEVAPGVRLQYRVSAINDFGTGDPSTVAEVVTQAAPDTAGNGAPNRTVITVNRRRVVISFDQNLDVGSIPRRVLFHVSINGSANRPQAVEIAGSTVVLTLEKADAVDASDDVRVRYTPPRNAIGDALVPTSRNALQDVEGNLVARWNALPATNETPLLVALQLDPDMIREGGVSTVTATMVPSNSPAPAPLTVTLNAALVRAAVASNIAQSGTTLTIARGAATSTGAVMITAMHDDAREDGAVTISGTVSGSQDVSAVALPVTLTIIDDGGSSSSDDDGGASDDGGSSSSDDDDGASDDDGGASDDGGGASDDDGASDATPTPALPVYGIGLLGLLLAARGAGLASSAGRR